MIWKGAVLLLIFLAGVAAGVVVTALAVRNGMEDHKE